MFAPLLDQIEAATSSLAAVDADEVELAEVAAAVVRLQRVAARVEALKVALVGVCDRRQAWKAAGARSAPEWLRDACNLSHGDAKAQVEVAHRLQAMPQTAKGFADGDVSLGKAKLAARTAEQLTRIGQSSALGELDALVAETAPAADEGRLREQVAVFRHRRDADALADRERRAFLGRGLRLHPDRPTAPGLDADLDVLGYATVATALEAASAPRGADDNRNREQRLVDGLVQVCRHYLDAGAAPRTGGHRPHLSAVADLATLRGEPGASPATLAQYGPISDQLLELLGCDCAVARVVMAGKSAVLDVGRATRTVSAAQRRALDVRDRRCVGCGAPASWCDAHHVIWWRHQGRTGVVNLVLLCRSCHTAVHLGLATIERRPDGEFRYRRVAGAAPLGQSVVRNEGQTRASMHSAASRPARRADVASTGPPGSAGRARPRAAGAPPVDAGKPATVARE